MKIENILFWLLIMASIFIIIWSLSGSPTIENAIFSLLTFSLSQIILLWKEFYKFKSFTVTKLDKIERDVGLVLKKL